MKRLTYILIPMLMLMLGACGGPDTEEELAGAEERKKELEGLLQTEEVNLQKNTMRLDALEEDISKMQSVIGNSDIDEYVTVVEDYAKVMETELTRLNESVSKAGEAEDLSILQEDIGDIRSNVSQAVEDYNDSVEGLELNEYLERQHSSLQLANDEITAALETIENGAETGTRSAVDEGLEALNSANEYY